MAANKTQPSQASVAKYLDSIEPAGRQADARAFAKLAQKTTGAKPVMWGSSIVGFGTFHYVYPSGREGDTPAVGFAARKNALVIYGLVFYEARRDLLKDLGPHTTGKGCVYIKDLSRLDEGVLVNLIRTAFAERANTTEE